MGIKDKLPLIRSESRIIRLFGYVVYAFVILCIIGLLVPSPTPTPEAPSPTPISTPLEIKPTPEYDRTLVRNYEIVKTEDISRKTQRAIRKKYGVVVPWDISKEELKATLIQVVMDKTSEDPDIDGIAVYAYDRKEDAVDSEAFTFGMVEWVPSDGWGAITPKIATTNDRSSYQYVFKIKDKVGNISVSNRPTEREFEIHDYYDDRLLEETKKLFEARDAGLPYKYADVEELENAVRTEVANKYGISEDELDKIWLKVGAYKM